MKIGQMQLSKDEKTYYIKLGAGVNQENTELVSLIKQLTDVLGSDVLFLQKPVDQIDFLLAEGKIDADTAASRKVNLPGFVKFNVNIKG